MDKNYYSALKIKIEFFFQAQVSNTNSSLQPKNDKFTNEHFCKLFLNGDSEK